MEMVGAGQNMGALKPPLSIHMSMHVIVPHNPLSATRIGRLTVHGQEETPISPALQVKEGRKNYITPAA